MKLDFLGFGYYTRAEKKVKKLVWLSLGFGLKKNQRFHYYHSLVLRNVLISPLRFFSLKRFSFDAFVGFVFFLDLGLSLAF